MDDTVRRRVVVAGDVTIDWKLLVPGEGVSDAVAVTYLWHRSAAVAVTARGGGPCVIAEIADAIAPPERIAIEGPVVPAKVVDLPHDATYPRTYSVWAPFRRERDDEPAWRITRFMGRDDATPVVPMPAPAAGPIDTLILDDTGFGIRERGSELLEALGVTQSPHHVILRMTTPIGEGALWKEVTSRFADRVTVCVASSDLRKEHAPIGQALSWERTASEVVEAVRHRPDLAGVARVIVSVGYTGAVLVERGRSATLVYDPFHQEGDWERALPGLPYGILPCLAAAAGVEATEQPDAPDWLAATERGLAGARASVVRGHVREVDGAGRVSLRFPLDEAAAAMRVAHDEGTFYRAEVPADRGWRLFAGAFPGGYADAARQIAVEGDRQACRALPVERMGAWASVDRTEIESMRSVRNIVSEYLSQPRRGRPLNIAVFGPPGSGKSFAIKQMAKQWGGGPVKLSVLEFNMAQFQAPADLPAALQRVRDCAVEESIPLVFWDEFDTPFGGRELGWLAQLLAPMQDGVFLEAGIARPIGPAIFIFAGGTHATMDSFKTRAVQIPGAKATDFISRLRGFVDILGPNPADDADETYVLRRALLLRAVLRQKASRFFEGERLRIDPGVLRAFLDVDMYLHGSRSLESIVEMSSIAGALRYERSALPAAHQLGLHVDPANFLALVQQEADRE